MRFALTHAIASQCRPIAAIRIAQTFRAWLAPDGLISVLASELTHAQLKVTSDAAVARWINARIARLRLLGLISQVDLGLVIGK